MLDGREVLKEYFGHSEFRSGQEQVVQAILEGRDALCVMPTGAGKSVCYQVPALMLEGITVVISPLISLMKDQVNALTQNGIRAAYLNSSLSASQCAAVLENLRRGIYRLIYVAPERLAVSGFLEVCKGLRIDLLAVDEAHCISQWGQDFRPSYLRISDFVDSLGYRPIIAAFTATATAEVKDDIEYSLKLRNPFRITTGFDRPNLKFEVLRAKKRMQTLFEILGRHREESGIVYCSTRRGVEELGRELNAAGYSATVYHAGLEDGERKSNQEDFVYDRRRVMVATNAFGMGIDKSNVSYVIHYNMPKDLESYYQEAGRAGRDGSDAECILLYSPSDVYTNRYFIEHSDPNPDLSPLEQQVLKERDYDRLRKMTFYCTVSTCLRHFILEYFGERSPTYCGNCSNCLTQFCEADVTEQAQRILSCIRETGQRFGKQMICDVLRGSKNARLLRLGLDSQPTYGVMRECSEAHLREVIDFLEFEEYIESRGQEYPTLALSMRAGEILLENERVVMKRAKPKEAPVKRLKRNRGSADMSVDRTLLAKLKALRRVIADEKRVPAYVVFSDATLVAMCEAKPATLEEMLRVSGVGQVKLRQYGERFLRVLHAHDGLENGRESES